MVKSRKRNKKRKRVRHPEEQEAVTTKEAKRAGTRPDRLSPFYNAGPALDLAPRPATTAAPAQEAEEMAAAANRSGEPGAQPAAEEEQAVAAAGAEPQAPEPQTMGLLPAIEGAGEPEEVVAFNRTGPLRLRGRADATFDGGVFHTENATFRPARDCPGCGAGECIRVTGTLVATYSVATTVTLPSVSDFPGLTRCQQRRVQNAIDNILAPHEQQHVRAFERYNGSTRRTFNLTLCRSAFDSAIESMFQAEESARRQAAQAASDALDPFHFDVDLECEEPPAPRSPGRSATSAAETPPTEVEPA